MTSNSRDLCGQLDDFLDDDLPADERQAFIAHAMHCTDCREAVDRQVWIDALLQSDESAAIESAPAIALRPRRRRAWLAAAALAALAAWPLIPLSGRDGSNRARSPAATERRAVAEAESLTTAANPSPSPSLPGRRIEGPPVATFASNGGAIALPMPATSADVTIVKLYPTIRSASRLPVSHVSLAGDAGTPGG